MGRAREVYRRHAEAAGWMCHVLSFGCFCVCVLFVFGIRVKLYQTLHSSQVVLAGKNIPADSGDIRDASQIPGLGRSLGERVFSCLENPVDTAAWWLQSIGWPRVRHN